MLSRYDWTERKILHFTVNACLTPLCYIHGYAVTTVEGVGNTRRGLHPIQKSLVASHGMQCGFCTPGMVMTMYCLVRNYPHPTQEQVERALEGNLCRCTGYRPIIDAFKPFLKDCPMAEQCCRNKMAEENELNSAHADISNQSHKSEESQDTIFPPELQLNNGYHNNEIKFQYDGWAWYRPVTLDQLKRLKEKHPNAVLCLGATSVVYAIKAGTIKSQTIICCTHVRELNKLEETENGLHVGAAITFGRLEKELKKIVERKGDNNTEVYKAMLKAVRWIAADQIRNIATVGGHIISADRLSDLNPIMMTVGATVHLDSTDGAREVSIDQSFFTGPFQTTVKSQEVLISVFIPVLDQFYKQPTRRGFDYAIVNACMAVKLNPDGITEDLRLSFGGLAQTTTAAKMVSKDTYINRNFDEKLLEAVHLLLTKEFLGEKINPTDEEKYRITLALSYFFKFYSCIKQKQDINTGTLSSATRDLSLEPCKGIQVFEGAPDGQPEEDSVGRPIPLVAGESMVSGEAVYIDDIPPYQNELFIGLVLSTKSHAEVLNVDISEAIKLPGVVDYVDHRDVPGNNKWGAIVPDEDLFAKDKVTSIGNIIGGIVATDTETAYKAAQLVKIEYRELKPIISIEEAIEADSFFESGLAPIKNGNLKNGFQMSDTIIEGELKTGYQEHFYLEPLAAIAVPKHEQKEIEIHVSAQSPTFAQTVVSGLLDIPRHKVFIRTRRAGGAFGGKETGCIYSVGPAAVAAYKTGQPVRCVLKRKDDFTIRGKRHPFLCRYKVGVLKDGKIMSIEVNLYVNAGHSLDLSVPVCQNAMAAFDGSYRIPTISITGHLCRTNTPSNTGFRGFGHPQALYMIENIITEIAIVLGLPQDTIREVNMYTEGDTTPYNKVLTECNSQKCWYSCKEQSRYKERISEIKRYNEENRWKKKGISIIPIKFPIGFPLKFLNQAGALVNIYIDGSVLISHAGVEIGQGIHTKMIQVASRVLSIPVNKIYISETATSIVPNTTTTGGSVSSDVNGAAVLDACTILFKRLEPYRIANPDGKWEDWVQAAYFDRVSLSATGYGKPYGSTFSDEKETRNPVPYFTFGSACTEVEIDCLTGEHQLMRTDIVMDVGKSLNPAIDIGQIEGGFMQGYGMMTTEKINMLPNGKIQNTSPVTYKIPGVRNVPREFKVTLLKDCSNEKAVYSSKGIGEPPLLLAISVMLAIKEAIVSARKDSGIEGNVRLDAPVTSETIRLACSDQFTSKLKL